MLPRTGGWENVIDKAGHRVPCVSVSDGVDDGFAAVPGPEPSCVGRRSRVVSSETVGQQGFRCETSKSLSNFLFFCKGLRRRRRGIQC